MNRKKRSDTRFENMGRVECPQLCALPGVLDDISKSGCKVRFPIPVDVDMENDYTLTVQFPQKKASPALELIGHPIWKNEGESGATEIGLSFLRSPDTPALNAFIEELHSSEKSEEKQIEDLIITPTVSFVL